MTIAYPTIKNISDMKPNWQPEWLVEDKHGCNLGITIDDHCFIVLSPDTEGQWHPIKHIPNTVARRIGQLANESLLDY